MEASDRRDQRASVRAADGTPFPAGPDARRAQGLDLDAQTAHSSCADGSASWDGLAGTGGGQYFIYNALYGSLISDSRL